MSTFSTQLRFVYFFHAAPRRLLSWADPGITVGGGGGGGDGVQVNPTKKALATFFFSLALILFYRSQMVNFKENFFFQSSGGGPNFSRCPFFPRCCGISTFPRCSATTPPPPPRRQFLDPRIHVQFYNLCTFTIFSCAGMEENSTIGIPIVLAQFLAPPIHFT